MNKDKKDLPTMLLEVFNIELSDILTDIEEGRKGIEYSLRALGELNAVCISTIEEGNRSALNHPEEYEKIR